MGELMEVMEHAIMEGYTIAWAADVSEPGFSRSGIAIIPDENAPENAGSDQEKWLGQSVRERDAELRMRVGREVLAEKSITQEMRQVAYDRYETTGRSWNADLWYRPRSTGQYFLHGENSWGNGPL